MCAHLLQISAELLAYTESFSYLCIQIRGRAPHKLNLNHSNNIMIHSICINGFEVCRHEKMEDYITCQNAIFATFAALRIRYEFQFNTYTYGEEKDRCLSVKTEI